MKYRILFYLMMLSFYEPAAQSTRFSTAVEVTGGFGIVTFSHDSLVPPKRRGKSRFDDILFVNGYFSFSLRNRRLHVFTGIGYVFRDFQLNKNNLGDFFTAIFSFTYNRDTFTIEQVKMKSYYLNVPVGISYNLTQDKDQGAQFYVGLQVNGSFLVSQQVTATFDPTYSAPNNQQIKEIEKKYAATEQAFVISIQPWMDLRVRVYRNIGLFTNLQPTIFKFNSYNKTLFKTRAFFCGSFGAYLDF